MRFSSPALMALLILLCGLWLRLTLHDVHGLEGDDGVALVLTRYDALTLIDGLRRQELDVHPPLYFLLLKGWSAVAGESLLALRFFNVVADVLTGAFLGALLRRLQRAALLALTLWMIAPLLLYSLYPIRMYTLMALWVTMGTWVLDRFVRHPHKGTGIALGVVCGAALMTHLYGVFLWGAALLVVGWYLGRGHLPFKRALSALSSLLVAALLFVPFGVPMLQRFLKGGTLGAQAGGAVVPLDMPGRLLTEMLTHRALTLSPLLGLASAMLFTTAVLWALMRENQSDPAQPKPLRAALQNSVKQTASPLWITGCVLTVGIVGLLALAIGSSVYRPRYAVPYVPLLLAVIAFLFTQGLRLEKKTWRAISRRWLARIGLMVIVMLSFAGLVQNLGRNVYDDWRGAAQFIATYAQAGDVVILIPRWGTKAFDYHHTSGLPVYGLFETITPDTDLEAITPLIGEAERIWLVRYQVENTDAANRAESWLQNRALSTEVFPTAIQVKLYDLDVTVARLPAQAVVLDVTFAERLRLHGYTLPITSGPARETRLHPPSNWVQVTLYLEALQALENTTLRVRLVDPQGGVWGGTLEREAGVLQRTPLAAWMPGTMYEVPFDVNLNPNTPPGVYRVEVMLLDANGVPLSAAGSQAGAHWAFAGEYMVR